MVEQIDIGVADDGSAMVVWAGSSRSSRRHMRDPSVSIVVVDMRFADAVHSRGRRLGIERPVE
jgi:hypothetical protein